MNRFKISFYFFISCFVLISCDPSLEDKTALGDLPSPSFDIIEGSDGNTFTLVNTTPDVFIINWVIEGVGNLEGEEVDIAINNQGVYLATLTVFNQGGSASTTKSITVTEDATNPCEGNLELLTDCGTKTWVLAPEAGALHVGPDLIQSYYSNSEDEVTERACQFDDEFIFSEDGTFEYKNNGDFWADSDGNGNVTPPELAVSVGCNPSSAWPASLSSWDSGTHSFNVDENNLTVLGEGAWIGLYKVGTSSEVTTPQSSVTYNISELSSDRMIIFADLGDVFWKFTLVTK